jgi:hypothetical protein
MAALGNAPNDMNGFPFFIALQHQCARAFREVRVIFNDNGLWGAGKYLSHGQ